MGSSELPVIQGFASTGYNGSLLLREMVRLCFASWILPGHTVKRGERSSVGRLDTTSPSRGGRDCFAAQGPHHWGTGRSDSCPNGLSRDSLTAFSLTDTIPRLSSYIIVQNFSYFLASLGLFLVLLVIFSWFQGEEMAELFLLHCFKLETTFCQPRLQ